MTRWLWTAADGTVTDLSAWGAGTYVVDQGTVGLLAPRYEFATQAYAGVDGERLQQVRAAPGAPVLGLDLVASDPLELRARVRALAHALRPRPGIGSLTAVADDGSTRVLPCYYRKGLEAGTYRATRYRTVLEFWAPSPWWRGQPVGTVWSLAAPTTFFPILPIILSATTIAGTATVDLSDTDSATYPQWTVTGPGSQLTLRNETTGAALVLNAAIADNEFVLIDTRPGQQSVRRATAGAITLTSELRRNLATNPNIETDSVGWWQGPSMTIARSTARAAYGAASLLLTATAAAASWLQFPATSGQTYTLSAYVRGTGTVHIDLRDSAGATVRATSTDVVLDDTAWRRISVTGVAAAAVESVTFQTAGAASIYVDGLLIELASTVGDYFDGDTANTPDTLYSWTGTAHASASIASRYTQGPTTVGASLFGSLGSDPALWPLVDGVNTVTALLTNAGPKSQIALTADRLYSGAL